MWPKHGRLIQVSLYTTITRISHTLPTELFKTWCDCKQFSQHDALSVKFMLNIIPFVLGTLVLTEAETAKKQRDNKERDTHQY